MNHSIMKKAIGVLIAVFILSVSFYGSFLPMRKSQIFISAMQYLKSVKSVSDLKDVLDAPLAAPSPIGQEELVRTATNVVLNLVQQNDKPEIIAELVNYVEKYYRPIAERGRGMSFEQNLYLLGALNETAYIKTNDIRYLQVAKGYYLKGLELGPKRPQFLYGMFDVYRTEGDVNNAKAVAGQILSQWPGDERASRGLQDFLDYVQAQSLTGKK